MDKHKFCEDTPKCPKCNHNMIWVGDWDDNEYIYTDYMCPNCDKVVTVKTKIA